MMKLMVAAALVSAPLAARAETCSPTAVVTGPNAAAQPLTKVLVGRGLQVEPAGLPAGPCPAVSVDVTPAGGQFRVRITDPWGRRAERTLADLATAATLIETWARMDLIAAAPTSTAAAAAAPVAVTTPELSAAPVVSAAVATPATLDAAAAAPAPTADEVAEVAEDAPLEDGPAEATLAPEGTALVAESSRLLVDLRGELGISRSRTVWAGSAATACVRLGLFCVGGLARVSVGVDRGGRRFDTLGLVTMPIALERLTLMPGLAVGAGFVDGGVIYTQRARGRGFVPDDGIGEDPQLRVEARLDLAYRITDHLNLTAGASASTSPDLGGKWLGSPSDLIVRGQFGIMWGVP